VSEGWAFEGFHHVQLAMPAGREAEATAFYVDVLGLQQQDKPAHLRARGGCWFRGGAIELHLGAQDGFTASGKAHPALRVRGLSRLREAMERKGMNIEDDTQLEGHDRWYVRDPFGNRLELIEER
jgi:catechol 2,3-dioxygenase-like lactoylglutathione lyase family enzyme